MDLDITHVMQRTVLGKIAETGSTLGFLVNTLIAADEGLEVPMLPVGSKESDYEVAVRESIGYLLEKSHIKGPDKPDANSRYELTDAGKVVLRICLSAPGRGNCPYGSRPLT